MEKGIEDERSSFVVIERTPGYLPESEPFETESYQEAGAYANELADELEEQGYICDRSWASNGNYYAIYCQRSDTVVPDLGRYIAVERDER